MKKFLTTYEKKNLRNIKVYYFIYNLACLFLKIFSISYTFECILKQKFL